MIDSDLLYATLFIGVISLSLFILRKLVESRKRKALNDAATCKSGHYWSPVEMVDHGFFCAYCKKNLTTGYECDFCCLKVDEVQCTKKISAYLTCKVNSQLRNEEACKTVHHWVPGNLEEERFCCVCDELCGGGIGLQDFRCSWCARVLHTRCRPKSDGEEECDFGVFRRFLIPPGNVTLRKAGNRNQRLPVIESVIPQENVLEWCPVIVMVNPKSGSGAGKAVLRHFRHLLHPVQVIDVTKSNIKASLVWIDEHPQLQPRILIAGGDGTISLVLNDIDNLENPPPVALLPLGTGNDLSRVMNWGSGSGEIFDVEQQLNDICNAKIVMLDRWNVSIEHRRKLGVRRFNKSLSMTNYVSIGVDACVTLGMQTTRNSIPKAMSSRLLNKLLFFTYGTKDVFERACHGLDQKLELYLDDNEEPIQLPTIEGLVFLNIPYWGAGVSAWEHAPEEWPQKLGDRKFEIFAVTSSLHIAQLQVGLSTPLFIGQASKAVLHVKTGELPMQSDGEAWLQHPGKITITHKGTSRMLENTISVETSRTSFF